MGSPGFVSMNFLHPCRAGTKTMAPIDSVILNIVRSIVASTIAIAGTDIIRLVVSMKAYLSHGYSSGRVREMHASE